MITLVNNYYEASIIFNDTNKKYRILMNEYNNPVVKYLCNNGELNPYPNYIVSYRQAVSVLKKYFRCHKLGDDNYNGAIFKIVKRK